MGNQMLFQGVRSTALKRGGVKTSRLQQFCEKTTSRNQTSKKQTDEKEHLSALRQGWFHSHRGNGQKNSWKQSKRQGKKDHEYQDAVKELEAVLGNAALNDRKVEEEAARPREARHRDRKVRTEEVLEIKEGLLYRKGMLWIPEDGNLKNPDSRIRTRHAGRHPHGPGQNDRDNLAQILVAKNERKNYRLHPQLPQMPEEQGGLAPTVQTFLPLGTTVCPLAVHRNGLHYGTATLRRMRPIVGG